MSSAAQEKWLQSHPFLDPIAKLQRAVEDAASTAVATVAEPRWDAYARDYAKAVPLLLSTDSGTDLRDVAAAALARVVDRAVEAPFPAALGTAVREIRDRFHAEPGAARSAAEWLLGGEGEAPPHAGLVRWLGWSALRPVLAPTLAKYAEWREKRDADAPWTKGYCPTCGALPGLGQLVESGTGKKRFLSCSCCGDRWGFRRIGCPFCGNEAGDRLEALELEGGEPLRVDHCMECNGYVKTYLGHGAERVFLADWTTLHLDALAREKKFERKGASLYDL